MDLQDPEPYCNEDIYCCNGTGEPRGPACFQLGACGCAVVKHRPRHHKDWLINTGTPTGTDA